MNTVKVAALLVCFGAAVRPSSTSPNPRGEQAAAQPTVRFIEDVSSSHGAILVVEVVDRVDRGKDGVDVDDDDTDAACAEEAGAERCAEARESTPRPRDRELAWPPWLALAARGPPVA